jgi:hypothetical protein
LERALTIQVKTLEMRHPRTIETIRQLLALSAYQGGTGIQDQYKAHAMALYEQMRAAPQVISSDSFFRLGMTMIQLGNYSHAKHCFAQAVDYRGQLLCLSIEMRTEEVQGSALLWMRADGDESNTVSFDNMRYNPVQGNTDWVQRKVIIYIPKASVALLFGAMLIGAGCAWFRNMQLEAVES